MRNAVATIEPKTDADPFATAVEVFTETGAGLLPRPCGSDGGCGSTSSSSCTSNS
ncbi:FxLD family lantipeptide [Streptomyces sp. NPDC047130]|uniref:FxLD family lantipeptide n=1 Tax=Streptomyces sp. NPDC047130 TaxID=3155261 RepID=UPI0033D3890D